MAHRKRSRDELEEADREASMGATLSRMKGEPESAKESARDLGESQQNEDGGEWQQVESRGSKRRKKQKGDQYPSITHSSHARLQSFVKIGDLQNLVLYLLADGNAPQWISVRHHASVRRVVVLLAPGLEAGMFDGSIPLSSSSTEEKSLEESKESIAAVNGGHASNGDGVSRSHKSPDDYYPKRLKHDRLSAPLQPLSDIFEHIWPIRTPGDDKCAKMHSPLAAMLTSPVVKTKEEKRSKGPQPPPEGRNWKNNRTPVTELIAGVEELLEAGYVLHPAQYETDATREAEKARRVANAQTKADGWVDSSIAKLEDGNAPDEAIEKGSLTQGRKLLALDCEMCITSPAGITPQVFSLTRASVIDWDGNTVMDEFVKPVNPITDYLTPYSGITRQMLENVTTTLGDVQMKLLSIITPQTILVGHSLESDLKALQLTHPFIIDTTILFPHPRGPPLKSSLKWLTQKYLSREIQKGHGSTGHDSIEDAKACLDLVKQKCEKGKAWGTPEASGEPMFKRLARTNRPKRDKTNPAGDDEPRSSAVVDWGDPSRGYGGGARAAIGCESDAEIVAGVKRALEGDADDDVVPKGGCDFVWARVRELEAHRGWWSHSKLVDSDALRWNATAASSEASLSEMVTDTVKNIQEVYEALPPCAAFVVYSGSGDPSELRAMQALQQQFKDEYKVKKWDELSVRWTDVEEQKLRRACEKARLGIGFVTVK